MSSYNCHVAESGLYSPNPTQVSTAAVCLFVCLSVFLSCLRLFYLLLRLYLFIIKIPGILMSHQINLEYKSKGILLVRISMWLMTQIGKVDKKCGVDSAV